jgi:hypothetical protein
MEDSATDNPPEITISFPARQEPEVERIELHKRWEFKHCGPLKYVLAPTEIAPEIYPFLCKNKSSDPLRDPEMETEESSTAGFTHDNVPELRGPYMETEDAN